MEVKSLERVKAFLLFLAAAGRAVPAGLGAKWLNLFLKLKR